MNEWILVGIAIAGTLVLAGGGAWISKMVRGKDKKEKTA